MAKKPVAWSYSVLDSYETCARRHYETRIGKRVVEKETDALRWGNKVHKALELYAKGEARLPEELGDNAQYVDALLAMDGKLVVEKKFALNKALQPVEYFAKDVWVRGVLDISKIGEKRAIILDWKTGKRNPDSDQLKLFAGATFALYPWIDECVTGFVWLKDKALDKEFFRRDQVTEIWDGFLPRVKRLEHAFEKDHWPPKPSGLCKSWCPVPKSLCEFSGGE